MKAIIKFYIQLFKGTEYLVKNSFVDALVDATNAVVVNTVFYMIFIA